MTTQAKLEPGPGPDDDAPRSTRFDVAFVALGNYLLDHPDDQHAAVVSAVLMGCLAEQVVRALSRTSDGRAVLQDALEAVHSLAREVAQNDPDPKKVDAEEEEEEGR